MPNHISNRVQIIAPDEDWKREDAAFEQLQALMKTDKSPFDFNVLIPYPQEYQVLDDARRKLEEEVGFAAAFSVKDGYNSGGYEWCRENWGTKWNAYDIGFGYQEVYFCTAWSTPLPIWAELSKRFPDMQLEIEYADEDKGNNCGRLMYLNGELKLKEDMSGRPHSELFARAVIAEQREAHYHAELKALQKPMTPKVADASEGK